MIGVTGATGAVGGRVAALLATLRTPTRLVVRDAARAPELAVSSTRVADYADSAAMQAALDGVRTLFLVSADADPARVQQQTTAVDAAVAAGVEHLVYLSFLGADPDATFTFARDHFRTEEHIRATGVAFTFLRPSLYLDSVPEWVGEDDVLRGPAGDGQVAWVSREDVAQDGPSRVDRRRSRGSGLRHHRPAVVDLGTDRAGAGNVRPSTDRVSKSNTRRRARFPCGPRRVVGDRGLDHVLCGDRHG